MDIQRITFEQPYMKVDLPIGQGDTVNFGLLLLEKLNPLTPLAFGAGWSARAFVRSGYDGAVILNNSTANGRISLGIQGTAPPDQFNVEVLIPASITAGLSEWGIGVWDLEIVDPFGFEYTWVRGSCYLLRNATR